VDPDSRKVVVLLWFLKKGVSSSQIFNFGWDGNENMPKIVMLRKMQRTLH
jgi:hypothetical protein